MCIRDRRSDGLQRSLKLGDLGVDPAQQLFVFDVEVRFEGVNSILGQRLITEETSLGISLLMQDKSLHQERYAERCLFCDQTLAEDRIHALEAHFNIEYEQLLSRIDAEIAELEGALKAIAALVLPNRAELFDDLVVDYDSAASAFEKASESVTLFLDTLQGALRKKKGRVFESLPLSVSAPEVGPRILGDVNEVVRSHNQACKDLEARALEARVGLEADSVAQSLDE